jgi:hypothetical protein
MLTDWKHRPKSSLSSFTFEPRHLNTAGADGTRRFARRICNVGAGRSSARAGRRAIDSKRFAAADVRSNLTADVRLNVGRLGTGASSTSGSIEHAVHSARGFSGVRGRSPPRSRVGSVLAEGPRVSRTKTTDLEQEKRR